MRKFLFAATLTLSATAAYAQLPDAYVGAGVTRARINNIFGSGRDFDLNNTAWKAFVGVKPLPFLGVEANYMDLGSQSHSFGLPIFNARGTWTPTPSLPSRWVSFRFPYPS